MFDWVINTPLFLVMISQKDIHCAKNVQIQSFLWSVFSCIWTECRDLLRKCPNTEFFLVRVFPYFDWMRRFTEKISAFSRNRGKHGPAKTPYLGIVSYLWKLFSRKASSEMFDKILNTPHSLRLFLNKRSSMQLFVTLTQ